LLKVVLVVTVENLPLRKLRFKQWPKWLTQNPW